MRQQSLVNLSIAWIAALAAPPAFGETISLPAARDGFVREQAPTLNYGGAGNLCVAGVDSQNAAEEPRGRFDSLIEFDTAATVATLNATYGVNGWTIDALQLRVSELGAPQNPIFPRGVGTARCTWLPGATFTEGIGTPNAPVTGTGNELTWDHLQTLLSGSTEQVLGELDGIGANGTRVCSLSTNAAFAQALRAGQIVTLHLSPVTADLGFTFIARNFSDPLLRPQLDVTVSPVAPAPPGDLNCDNQLNIEDVPNFALALVDPLAFDEATDCDINRADLDANGEIDGRDIARFVESLATP